MENISFFIKQFFISFLAGCITNFYLIIYYSVLKTTDVFPEFFNNLSDFFYNTPFPEKINPTIAFIIIAVLIGAIMEGFGQIGFSKYIYGNERHTIKGRCLYFLLMKPTIFQVCNDYSKNQGKNPIEEFITDSKEQFLSVYDAVCMCATIIEKNGINIRKYRDISYILQALRFSFIFIALTAFISGICFLIYDTDKLCSFAIEFILVSLVALIIIFCITSMSYNFGKRYIHDVARTYRAFKLKLPIQKIDSANDSEDEG